MPDYNLFGLSPRSFEQLIQALSVEILGPDVVIFGDGPDGAREATFFGKIKYPNQRAPWNGHGIVQAKFLQRSSGKPKQDADWLLGQLAEEMKKFRKRGTKSNKKRVAPDYYLLATNVILSPKAESGGKDRVHAVLRKYQKTLGWKGFEVWDADKISRFLDAHRQIATTYAAWITAGDVLEAVITALKPKRADFHEVMFTFLQKELLAAQYANLRQAGHTDQERVALSRVFVDLPVSERQWLEPPDEIKKPHAMGDFVSELLNQGSWRLSETESCRYFPKGLEPTFPFIRLEGTAAGNVRIGEVTESRITAQLQWHKAAFRLLERKSALENKVLVRAESGKHVLTNWFSAGGPRPGRIVLLGGPGQGKTTVGQFACQIYRASILQDAKRGLAREVREALRLIRTQCGQSVHVPLGRRYPLHIDLKVLAAFLAKGGSENPPSLLEFMRARISQRADAEVSGSDLRMWLKEYPWFIVFDGLDEVPATGNREGTMQCINEFMVDVDALEADVLVLATCRPQSYAKEFDEKHYRHLWLAPLSNTRALDYGNRLLEVRHSLGPDLETYKARLATAAKVPATARLMRSPLQVTIMAALVERVGLPPEQRWSLFSEYYRVIYDRETERGTKWSAALRDFRTDVDLIHRYIGFSVHRQSEAAGVETNLKHDEFRAIVRDRLAKEGHSGAELENLIDILCEAVKDRLVFLSALTAERIGFEIRSLQEFMAGDYLMDSPDASPDKHDETVRKNLATVGTSPHWRNVFLFAAGRIYAKEQRFRDSLEALCQQVNESDDDTATAANLGGSRLALDLLEDGSARNQPKSARLLMRVAARLLDLPPSSVHQRLLHQSNPNTEGIFREELERRLSSTSETLWATACSCLGRLCHKGTPWALQLVSQFLSDDPQRLAIALRVTQSSQRQSRLTDELVRRASRIPMSEWLRWHRHAEKRIMLFPKSPSAEPFAAIAETAFDGYGSFKNTTGSRAAMISATVALQPKLGFYLRGSVANIKRAPTHEEAAQWHFSWKVFLAGVRFAMNPNADSLAEELEWLLQNWESSGWRFSSRIPWQVQACLHVCKTPDELRSLVAKVRAGELGDRADWETAEKRWNAAGVTIDDFIYASPGGLPFDKNVGKVGIPHEIAGLHSEMATEPRLLEQLIECYPQIGNAFLKERLLKLILSLQWFLGQGGNEHRSTEIVDRSMRILRKAALCGIGIIPQAALLATSRMPFSGSDLDFYDQLGRSAFQAGLVGLGEQEDEELPDGFAPALARAFVQNPQRVGLVRLLAFCLPDWANKSNVPIELLRDGDLRDDSLRCAKVIMQLDQIAWTKSEAASLARAAAEALKERPDIVERTCSVIEKSSGTGEEREEFLVALLREIPDHEWQLRSRVIEALDVLLTRRSATIISLDN